MGYSNNQIALDADRAGEGCSHDLVEGHQLIMLLLCLGL